MQSVFHSIYDLLSQYVFGGDLSSYAYDKLSSLDNIKIVSCKGDSIILFEIIINI